MGKEGITIAALNTDLLKKLSRRWVGQVGAGGVTDAVVTTIPLSSTTNLATDTAVVATINRVDPNGDDTPALEETVIGVVSGSNLVNCVRGVEGTAQTHDAGDVVEILVTAKGWNDIIDMLLVQHTQLGGHTNITGCNITASGTTTASHITASDVTARIYNGPTASTVAIDGSGYATVSKALRSATTTVDVSAATAPSSGQVLTATASTTATWQTPSTTTDGWTASSDTWTYASASTFTIAGVDRTAVYTKGTRLKFTNSGTKYAVVKSSSFSTNTTVTIFTNSDYTIANAAITSPYYSYEATPQGYPTWFNFATTFIGFSADPASYICRYAVLGTACTFVYSSGTSSTSNSTAFSMTAPATATTNYSIVLCRAMDNGGNIVDVNAYVNPTTDSLTLEKTVGSVNSWTASGRKDAYISLTYEYV